MNNIEDIIRYESECGYVEFKSEQYLQNGTSAFVKDMMAMANSPITGKKYIIIGVAEKGGNKNLVGLSRPLDDSANYYQAIHSAIEPEIRFSVKTVTVDGREFGVFIIEENGDRPYMMKKDGVGLKKGECYIRKGSSQDRLIRRDLDEIWEQKSSVAAFDGDVLVSGILENESPLVIGITRFVAWPSEREAKKIQDRIDDLKFNRTTTPSLAISMQPDFYYGMDVAALTDQLNRIQKTYEQEDRYEKFETHGSKVNFIFVNTGSKYIENVSVRMVLPALPGLEIAPRKYYSSPSIVAGYLHSNFITKRLQYPEVKKIGDIYEIRQPLGDLPHHIPTALFVTPIRVFAVGHMADQHLSAKMTIYGKNLPKPLEKDVVIQFGE